MHDSCHNRIQIGQFMPKIRARWSSPCTGDGGLTPWSYFTILAIKYKNLLPHAKAGNTCLNACIVWKKVQENFKIALCEFIMWFWLIYIKKLNCTILGSKNNNKFCFLIKGFRFSLGVTLFTSLFIYWTNWTRLLLRLKIYKNRFLRKFTNRFSEKVYRHRRSARQQIWK